MVLTLHTSNLPENFSLTIYQQKIKTFNFTFTMTIDLRLILHFLNKIYEKKDSFSFSSSVLCILEETHNSTKEAYTFYLSRKQRNAIVNLIYGRDIFLFYDLCFILFPIFNHYCCFYLFPLKFSHLKKSYFFSFGMSIKLTVVYSQNTVTLSIQLLCGFNFVKFIIQGQTDILFQLVSMTLQRIILSQTTSNKTAYNFYLLYSSLKDTKTSFVNS